MEERTLDANIVDLVDVDLVIGGLLSHVTHAH